MTSTTTASNFSTTVTASTTAPSNSYYYHVVTSGTVYPGQYKFTPYVPTCPNTITVPGTSPTFTIEFSCATCDEPLEAGEQTVCKKCKKVIKAMRAIVVEDEEEEKGQS